jgi:hypothetical protein
MGYNDKFYLALNNCPLALRAVSVPQWHNMSKLDKTDIALPNKGLMLFGKTVSVLVEL